MIQVAWSYRDTNCACSRFGRTLKLITDHQPLTTEVGLIALWIHRACQHSQSQETCIFITLLRGVPPAIDSEDCVCASFDWY